MKWYGLSPFRSLHRVANLYKWSLNCLGIRRRIHIIIHCTRVRFTVGGLIRFARSRKNEDMTDLAESLSEQSQCDCRSHSISHQLLLLCPIAESVVIIFVELGAVLRGGRTEQKHVLAPAGCGQIDACRHASIWTFWSQRDSIQISSKQYGSRSCRWIWLMRIILCLFFSNV